MMESVKQTRKIVISEKVFTGEDLRRIAKIFDKQKTLAAKSAHDVSIAYEVKFSNDTTLETDSPELFADESLTGPSRPVAVRMSFRNYSLKRHLEISLEHGDSAFATNVAVISADDSAWLSENFLALKEAIDKVAPQSFWFRQHKTLLVNLLALGLGTLARLIIDIVVAIFFPHPPQWIIKIPAAWEQFFPLLYIVRWIFLWGWGFFLGASGVRHWLLSMWPSIEFDFGLDHLKTERVKRQRLIAVGALIILPIMTSLIAELIHARF
jgi:hypothetical protein